MQDGQGADDQMQKIQEEKSALRRQLIALVILSFVISGMFYGITLLQNPYNKDWASRPAQKHTEMWMNVQKAKKWLGKRLRLKCTAHSAAVASISTSPCLQLNS